MTDILKATALALLVGVFGVVTASTASTVSCTDSSMGLPTYSACEGPISGNDDGSGPGSIQVTDTIFGLTGWEKIEKVDAPASTSGDLSITGSGGTSGTWTWSGDFSAFSAVMIAVKGGPTYSLYRLADLGTTTGAWDTLGITKGSGGAGPGLSHLTLWGVEGTPTPPVPLPAAGWMLLAGVGGLAAWGRKRRRS